MSKYVTGYLPKIQYWSAKLQKAVDAADYRMIDTASIKLKYFTDRQMEVYGEAGVGHS
mgnify:FL=1